MSKLNRTEVFKSLSLVAYAAFALGGVPNVSPLIKEILEADYDHDDLFMRVCALVHAEGNLPYPSTMFLAQFINVFNEAAENANPERVSLIRIMMATAGKQMALSIMQQSIAVSNGIAEGLGSDFRSSIHEDSGPSVMRFMDEADAPQVIH